MSKKKLPRSLRKHIQREKARIRREVLDLKKSEELIKKLYEKLFSSSKKTKKLLEQKPLKNQKTKKIKRVKKIKKIKKTA